MRYAINGRIFNLKILFFGLGSIGLRHARLIKKIYNYDIYAYRTNLGQEKTTIQINEIYDLKEALSIKPDVAFITNPTNLHVKIANLCAKANIPLFIEKPISNSLEGLDELVGECKRRNLFTYVAYNLRFNNTLNFIKSKFSNKKPIYFRATCSSYLPRWRLNQDYRKSYSASKESGGVILDLSHEFDYLWWLFGEISILNYTKNKISNLEIESEDVLDANTMCGDIYGNVHLDYFSMENQRKLQLYYNDMYVEAN
jgi:predicted dehydrogenase